MKREPVSSDAIAALGYDASSETLEVEFRGGKVYRYLGVPPSVFAWLERTPHKGAFVARKIVDQYPFEEQGAAEPQAGELEAALRASLDPADPDEPTR